MHDFHFPADPVAAVTHPDPWPYYAALAARPPYFDERLRLWVVADPARVRDALARDDFLVRPAHEPVPAAIAGPAGELFGAVMRMNEGPRHAGPKVAAMGALARLTPDAAAACARATATRLAAGVTDAAALNRYVLAVPVQTVAGLLGFTEEDLPRVAAWTGQFAACLSPLATPADIGAAHDGAAGLLNALRTLAARPRHTTLLAGMLDAPWPDERTMLANLAGLLSQTFEATAGLLGTCIAARLAGAEGDAATLVAQARPAIHNTRRFAARDLVWNDVRLRAGEGVLLVLAAAGAGFGYGRHTCPGQALAGTIVTQALLALGTLPPVAWRYRPSVNARLPVFVDENRKEYKP